MRDALVVLHGANGSAPEMQPLTCHLPDSIDLVVENLVGHGGRPVPERFAISAFGEDVVRSMDAHGVERAVLFGYSVGGLVALWVARHFPERVRAVITLATKFVWDANTVRHLTHLADPDRLTRNGNPRGKELARIHSPADWREVNGNNRALFAALGEQPAITEEDLRAITVPALVICSTGDQLVPLEEAKAMAALFRGWRLLTFEGYCHPLGQVPLEQIAKAIVTFIDDVETWEQRRDQAVRAGPPPLGGR